MSKRGPSQVAQFIDGIWQYVIEERADKFVVVVTWKESPFDTTLLVVAWKESPFDTTLLRRKIVTCREDASDPLATREEAEAFIAKRLRKS